nr:PorP/SprF family type IX secretion system membrane protein [Pedobacter sp. ASV2]
MKIILITILSTSISAYAQLNPMGSMYFQNEYLMNSAMAGNERGWSYAGALKAQWTAVDGAPIMQSITADYGGAKRRVGLGFAFYNERAGVFKRTSMKLTYAYHISIGNSELNFIDLGLSGGVMNETVDLSKVKGDLEDVSLYDFNNRPINFDGDFGIAFRLNKLTVQGNLPNLKRYLKRDLLRTVVDRTLFFSALGYKISLKDGGLSSIEPKFVYRAVQNYSPIVDLGANLILNDDRLIFNAMYHSTNSMTFGVGTLYKENLSVLCLYTTNTSGLRNYSNGEVEIGLRLRVGK